MLTGSVCLVGDDDCEVNAKLVIAGDGFAVNGDAYTARNRHERYVLTQAERRLRAAAYKASPPRCDPKPVTSRSTKRRSS